MNTSMTTLALNLLISERLNHRSFFASKMTELLDSLHDNSDKDKQIKSDFIAVINQCVEDPTGKFNDVFYHYSQYYAEKISGAQKNFSSAA